MKTEIEMAMEREKEEEKEAVRIFIVLCCEIDCESRFIKSIYTEF